MVKAFNSMSENLGQDDKHFQYIYITLTPENGTLDDNSFGDIIFDSFLGEGINKISTKTFNRDQTDLIDSFWCEKCWLQNQPPKYDLWNVFGQMNRMTFLSIDLNVTEIPSNAINGHKESQLGMITIYSSIQNLTIKSHAFRSLKKLEYILFREINFTKFENQSLVFGENLVGRKMNVMFLKSNLSGDTFEPGTFDGVKKPIAISFTNDMFSTPEKSNIKYIPESAFKRPLNNPQSTISSTLDCFDCRNHWLIKDNKEHQFIEPLCNEYINDITKKRMFDQDIKTYLRAKCYQF